ncbi:MAG: AbgT family transporter [Rheinheimera sp.]|nr:AbgT family transporter [Rheinheimera sp.]
MELGVSPDLTQAAYRVGDSSTNIITPLMPYFPINCGVLPKICKSHWDRYPHRLDAAVLD